MYTHPIQQHKHIQKGLLPKPPVLHAYILSTTKRTQTQTLIATFPSLTCLPSYLKKNIRTDALCHKFPVLHAYIPYTKTQT